MVAELVRPDVSGADWGGFDLDRLRIAGLARAVQTRLPYLHHCICREDGPIVTPDGRPMTPSESGRLVFASGAHCSSRTESEPTIWILQVLLSTA